MKTLLKKSLNGAAPPLAGESSFETVLQADNADVHRQMLAAGRAGAQRHRGHVSGLNAALSSLLETYRYSHATRWEPGERERQQVEQQEQALVARRENLREKAQRTRQRTDEKISRLDEAVRTAREAMRAAERPPTPPPPDALMLWLTGGLLVALSVALYVFYVNVAYKAFFPVADLPNGAGGARAAEAMLRDSGIFTVQTFRQGLGALYPALFPAILFGLGMALHLVLDHFRPRWLGWKALLVGGVLLLTLGLDVLIAAKIHAQLQATQNLLRAAGEGQHEPWYLATNVWIVIGCGFLAFLIWSGLLHGFQHLRHQGNPARQQARRQRVHQRQLDRLAAERTAAEQAFEAQQDEADRQVAALDEEGVGLREQLHERKYLLHYSGKIRLCLQGYYEGWLEYLNGLGEPHEPAREAMETFVATHFVKNPTGETPPPRVANPPKPTDHA